MLSTERQGLAATAGGRNGPEDSSQRWWRVLAVGAQFALLVLVMHRFELENPAVLRMLQVALVGFAVHAVLPRSWRLAFFALLSMVGIAIVLGPLNGAWVLGLGLALVGIVHLPTRWPPRIALLLAAGAALALLRTGWLAAPFSGAIWPILGAMFMFRLVVYVYDQRHDPEPFRLSRTLAYFFMLPSTCFPLFPVVDYATFRDGYYDRDAAEIYQQGLGWILRGITHLLLYRLVYYHLTLAPSEVATASDLIQFLVSNILLYLRVSGQFHIIVGLLKLFGFNLPETNHLYFLASSFSEYWRRINIYWKDFMMKVFYYPAYFALRRRSSTVALMLATAAVFFVSWMLHSYQWFWIQGSFPLRSVDVVFWGTVGALVLVNSLLEAKRAKRRSLAQPAWSPRRAAKRALRIAGTFSAICVLWSLWTSDSVAEWLDLWRAGSTDWRGAWWVVPMLAVLGIAGALEGRLGKPQEERSRSFWRSAALPAATALALLALSHPALSSRLGEPAERFVASLSRTELNDADVDMLRRGYYEQLTHVERFDSRLSELGAAVEKPELGSAADPFVRANDFVEWHIVPNVRSTFADEPFSTNRWGMRDQDYDLRKPSGTFRIALVGASTLMGSGVADDEVFETLLEERLNREAAGGRYRRYELLNFGIRGHGPLRLAMGAERVASFEPDVLLYFGQPSDWSMLHWNLLDRIQRGIELPDLQPVREAVEAAALTPDMPQSEMSRSLRSQSRELVGWSYGEIVKTCKSHGIEPWFVFLPEPRWEKIDRLDELSGQATEAGFRGILSLRGTFDSVSKKDLWISPRNPHPNAEGHQLIAETLYSALREAQSSGALDLGLPAAPAPPPSD